MKGGKRKRKREEMKGKKPAVIHDANRLPPELSEKLAHGMSLNGPGIGAPRRYYPPSDWEMILQQVYKEGFKSVMIEGGAQVINALLKKPELVDSVIITIAPTWLGRAAVQVSPETKRSGLQPINAANLENPVWQQFGQDMVLCGKLR